MTELEQLAEVAVVAGTRRLGELALVDGESAVARVPSGEHRDLTIGGPEVRITGVHDDDPDADTLLIRDGRWMLA